MSNTFELAAELGNTLRLRGWMLTTAESCTGGSIAAAVTDIAGSSDWFDRGFVTYSNQAKQDMLGVSASLIEQHGAVSSEVAEAMAAGALGHSRARVAVAVTGIAGPGGGSPEKPIGTVWFGWGFADDGGPAVSTTCRHFPGDRASVRRATVEHALQELERRVRSGRNSD